MPEWTTEQQQAIDLRKGGLLVSAAAGSGKTAVLSHRTVKYVKKGGSLSRLLIVTFTRLAASEMKQRISDVLASEYKANPSEHLKREKISVYGAKISTIDSYCASLLRENFQKVGLSPDFSMVSESEYADIKAACLERQLEEYYATYKNDFAEMLKLLGGEQNSDAVAAAVNEVYKCLCAVPFPEKWLEHQLEKHRTQDYYIDLACKSQAEMLSVFRSVYGELLASLPFKEKEMSVVQDEYGLICRLHDLLLKGDWNGACKEVREYEFSRSPSCKSGCKVSQKYKYYRELLKTGFLAQEVFLIDTEEARADAALLYPQIRALVAFVTEYSENIRAEFRKKNRFSFDFISQTALSLLVSDYDHETGRYSRTELAEKIAESFDEIMIDEYQDVNDVQDLFFRAISDDGEKLFAVGDVKQSIYRFRHANPKNFIHRSEELNTIYLNKNFRSKKSILDFINFIFEGLFSRECCGMVYSEGEKLYAGLKGETAEDDVEYILAGSGDGLDKVWAQAGAVAKRIKELLRSGYQVFDKSSGATRPLRLGDVAVLAKSIKKIGPVYEKVFRNAGINLAATGTGSLWDSVEVNTVTAFLNIIDNPYDDLAFFAVMFSDVYSFSAEKIARIRLADRKAHLFEACKKYLEETGDGECEKFLSDLKRYSLLSKNLLPDRLIRQIYSDTSYAEKVSCLENGYLRRENLMKLYDLACKWSSNTGGSLYDFLVYTETARLADNETSEETDASPDSVRIMTIHKSKGLEFPVCFLANADAGLSLKKTREKKLFCEEKDGFSSMIRDRDMLYETTTLPREVMKAGELRELIAEEMRVLYVALTRAREKLIIVSSEGSFSDKKLKEHAVCGGESVIPAVRLLLAGSLTYEDLMLLRLVHHERGGELRSEFSSSVESESGFTVRHMNVRLYGSYEEEETEERVNMSSAEALARMEVKTDGVLSHIPAKLAVTELIKGSYRDEEGRPLFESLPEVKKPAFITGKTLSPTQRGTAMHKYCRYADLSANTEGEIRRLTENGYLTEEEAKSLNRSKIEKFRTGLIASLISEADEVRREDEFVVRLPSFLYDRTVKEAATILVQGAMDLLLRKGDELILVDYKTDRAESDELIDRYRRQLYLYRLAAQKAYGLPVSKVYIWSFHLSTAIDCTPYLPQ